MSLGIFRGKESSNRIELSQLVRLIEFWCFGLPAALGRGQVGGGHLQAWRVSLHTCTCTHTHLYMYRNCKWPLTWRHPCLACLTCMCMRACMHVHVCMHGTPSTHPYPPPPHPPIHHPPGGGPPESIKIR